MWACPRRSANVVWYSAGLYVVRRVRARGAAPPGFAPHVGRRPGRRALRRGARLRPERPAAPPRPAAQESGLTIPGSLRCVSKNAVAATGCDACDLTPTVRE